MIQKWEYEVVGWPVGTDTLIKDLNDLGHQGWELVQLDFSNEPVTAVFKRPVIEVEVKDRDRFRSKTS